MSNHKARPELPREIANGIILPDGYADESRLHQNLTWVRSHMPLALATAEGHDPVWFVSKHADVRTIEADPELFSSALHNPILGDQQNEAFLRELTGGTYRTLSSLTYMDPPEHTLVRNASAQWFSQTRLNVLEAQIRQEARSAVAGLLDHDGECDFVRDFALNYPLRVVMTIFGVPREDEPLMLKLTQDFFGTSDPDEQRSEVSGDPLAAAKQWQSTLEDFFSYFRNLTVDRRKQPREDLLSAIANYRIDGEFLSDEVANGYYVAIATAGHDTTSSSIAGGMEGLVAYPDEFLLARTGAQDTSGLTSEAIRWTSPVKHFMRVATRDTTLRGEEIRRGDRLFLSYPSANRDEEVFQDPFRFSITRRPNPHIAFGFGPHICLGQRLARFEMEILFQELLPHLKSVALLAPPERVRTNFVGGIKSMPIRFEKS